MITEQIAAFPMYDYPELAGVHDALWTAVADRLRAAGVGDAPRQLTRTLSHFDVWRHPRLLLAQGCEYPLAKSFAGCVRIVATPRYAVPGSEGGRYRSAIVVRKNDPAEHLSDLRHRRCVINEPDSNSGMNLLRAAIAPVSGGAPFFQSVAVSGSHRRSTGMVATGEADVAALDGVSFAHFEQLEPRWVGNLRVLCWSPPSPCPPFITASQTSDTTIQALRFALRSVIDDPMMAGICKRLFLAGLHFEPNGHFVEVLQSERRALEQGYPTLV